MVYYEGFGGEGIVRAEVNQFCVVALGEEVGLRYRDRDRGGTWGGVVFGVWVAGWHVELLKSRMLIGEFEL